jgi:hypothetical protein
MRNEELVANNEEVQQLRRELEECLAKLEAVYMEQLTLKKE